MWAHWVSDNNSKIVQEAQNSSQPEKEVIFCMGFNQMANTEYLLAAKYLKKGVSLKRVIIFCLFLLVLSTTAYCGQICRIMLMDGSIINGEIVSYEKGIYRIRTANFGELTLESAKIYRIDPIETQPPNIPISSVIESSNPTPSEINKYKQKLMNDPESVAIITKLATEPQIQEIASDSQIRRALDSGDIQTLLKNKKFTDIVNSPAMRETVEKLRQQIDSD